MLVLSKCKYDTHDQSSDSIIHAGHLYKRHFPVFREELESLHGEAILSESISDFFFGYSITKIINTINKT